MHLWFFLLTNIHVAASIALAAHGKAITTTIKQLKNGNCNRSLYRSVCTLCFNTNNTSINITVILCKRIAYHISCIIANVNEDRVV